MPIEPNTDGLGEPRVVGRDGLTALTRRAHCAQSHREGSGAATPRGHPTRKEFLRRTGLTGHPLTAAETHTTQVVGFAPLSRVILADFNLRRDKGPAL